MEFFKRDIAVVRITAAVFVPHGNGAPIHRNRAAHGFAFNVDCDTTYRFETGEILTCQSGECIYLPKGSNYTVDKKEPAKSAGSGVYAINFLTSSEDLVNPPFITKVKGKDEILSSFEKAEVAWRKKGIGFYEECFISLYRIIKILKKDTADYLPVGKVLRVLVPALEYIDQNYTKENISTAYLAKLCNVSEPYLRKLFHNAFSVAPAVYMRNLRIKYAKGLLRSGEYSVTDVALLSGFNDIAYFSREFKKATGKPPKAFNAESPSL